MSTLEKAWKLYHSGNTNSPFSEEYEAALKILTQLTTSEATAVEAYNLRSHIYYLRGDFNQALSDLNQVIKLNPNFAEAFYSRAYVYKRLANADASLADYKTALLLARKQKKDDLIDAIEHHVSILSDDGNDIYLELTP